MADSKTTTFPETTGATPAYQKFLTSKVEPEPGKLVWKEVREQYNPEGYTAEELAGLDYSHFAKLFRDERPTKSPKAAQPRLGIPDLTSSELWQILRSERSVAIRAKAFTELMRRESERSGLAPFVVEELARDNLKPTWRNTLIFATEHLDFLDPAQRQRLGSLLARHVADLSSEWHPRSRLAQEAALRRYGSLIDNKVNLSEIVRFLGTDYPLRVRLIALQTIQNAFATAPPSVSLRKDLGSLRNELEQMVGFFFRPETLARSEEDFDLGLTALEALIRLGDPIASRFVLRVREIGKAWVGKQLQQFLSETRTAWSTPDSAPSPDSARAVCDALDVLQRVASEPNR
ncbi:MAG: hypothetical protein HQ567_17870 [Candidatus Nealsonbacteria bacterium]|nr:hypothetical protein [Candidatus Nealsonbacteria bacterium]